MRFLILFLLIISSKALAFEYDARLTSYDYPFPVQYYSFETQNQELQMAYMDLKPENPKGSVLLLHGKNFAGYYWERIAKDLKSRGYRVIIPDQIGFGKSSKPRFYHFSFRQLAMNTIKLLDKLQVTKVDVVGHSMGGMLATHLTFSYPQRISRLLMINPIGLEPYLNYVKYKDPGFFFQIEQGKSPEKMRNYQKKNYYDGAWSEDYEALLIPHIGQMNGPEWKRVAWNNALTYGPIFLEDITRLFGEIETPTHLILGTRDKTGPGRNWKKEGVRYTLGDYTTLGDRVIRSFPNGKLYKLEGLGHMPQFEDYERFSRVFYSLF